MLSCSFGIVRNRMTNAIRHLARHSRPILSVYFYTFISQKEASGQWESPCMRLPFTTCRLSCMENPPMACARAPEARGDRPRDIHHLQGGIWLCRQEGPQGLNSSRLPFLVGGWGRDGGYLASKPFIMFSPKQLLCKQTWLRVGKSVISTLDLLTRAHSSRAGPMTPAVTRLARHGGGWLQALSNTWRFTFKTRPTDGQVLTCWLEGTFFPLFYCGNSLCSIIVECFCITYFRNSKTNVLSVRQKWKGHIFYNSDTGVSAFTYWLGANS